VSLPRGPLRIVLIRSGGYDYADVELHAPVHLVAANNVGKTSLIAALQFLYIDDARQMHFSHDWNKTRRHYFPKSGSLVLFECMTPTGLQVFGVRGLGPVMGFEYERFAYRGAYQRTDYLDGRAPRSWEEVASRLIDRDLREIEPKTLRASLTGSGDAKGAPLGLVPLRRSGSYDSFRFLFRNLLGLSKISQEQLKSLFIDICRPRLRQTEIDLRKEYAELFGRVERESQGVQALQLVAPAIAKLIDGFERRRGLRCQLISLWGAIESELKSEHERVEATVRSLELEGRAIQEDRERLRAELDAVGHQGNEIAKEQGALSERSRELVGLSEKARAFVPELEAATRKQLQSKHEALAARIVPAKREARAHVEQQLKQTRAELATDRRLVEHYADAVVTWLRSRAGLSERALGDLFDVLNPTLLAEVLGEGRVSIVDEASAVALIGQIHQHIGVDGFDMEGIRVRRRPTDTPSALDRYQDVEVIHARIANANAREVVLVQLLEDIAELPARTNERDAIWREITAAAQRLHDWGSWNARRHEIDEVSARQEVLHGQATENAARQSALQPDLSRIALREDEITRRVSELRDARQHWTSDVQRLQAPPSAWASESTKSDSTRFPLDELVRSYRTDWDAQRQVSQNVENLFREVEEKTAGKYVRVSEIEMISSLQDQLAALDNRERALRELWTSLVDGMRSAFKSLIEGVDEIGREVSRLTSALGRRQISNLERVELELVRQRDLVRKLEAVIEVDASPLFAGPGGRTRAAQDVQSWLEQRPFIDLKHLFDLRFKVVDAKGQVKAFDSLTQIESEGTSTTIKVLVHLELLRSMLSNDAVAVPFFLDEVATLDEPNLQALIEHATGMGFVPVVASPDARDCVDTLYFLRPSPGGLVLDETSRVRLPRRQADAH